MSKPTRIQLKRTKGWRLVEASKALNGLEAVKVTRPGKWGNPFKVGEQYPVSEDDGLSPTGEMMKMESATDAVKAYRDWFECVGWAFIELDIEELSGKNLACFCPLDQSCHADVLLELANNTKDQTHE